MILLIGGEKGGTGKSTIATNLAAYRKQAEKDHEILIVDTDPQGSSSDWTYYRKEDGREGIDCVQIFGKRITSEIPSHTKNYHDIIIDAGGRDSKELRYAMGLADAMIVPVGPSQYDLNTIEQIEDLLIQVEAFNEKLECYVLINRLRNIPNMKDLNESIMYLKDFEEINVCDFQIHERIAFTRSSSLGLGVSEMKNGKGQDLDPKAIAEIKKLYELIWL
jgi:chromosome partitioning protein